MFSAATFAEIAPREPDHDAFLVRYDALSARIERAVAPDDAIAAIRDWDALRREFLDWDAMANLRFHQATGDPVAIADSDRSSARKPVYAARDAHFKRAVLASPFRPEIVDAFGAHVLALWGCDVEAIDDRIVAHLKAEAVLEDEYVALLGAAQIAYDGAVYSLPGIAQFGEDADRSVRETATRAKWAYYEAHRAELDRVYGGLVRERTAAARALGYSSFTELGYRRMRRTDYGPSDVAALRDEVVREIVPLCARIVAEQARAIGVDRLMPWDLEVYDTADRLRPPTGNALTDAARVALASAHPDLGRFADLMIAGGLHDLPIRDGKAGGGFCTSFPTYGLPFVYANCNGTTHDVNVLVHELGHAFQCFESRDKALADHLWPTLDACEINSMGMEFLVRPHFDAFFGDEAERYRRRHLAASLLLLPYGCAVDHFQHLVYERPDATPAERNAMWRSVEARYLPWRVAGGIPHIENGGSWQQQRHIYKFPFYYIDYVLAMSCALQFWTASLENADDAIERYVALCARGGEAPFQTLVRSAGLRSPFDGGVFSAISARATEALF
jgi:M3 family oligoendopeptidase